MAVKVLGISGSRFQDIRQQVFLFYLTAGIKSLYSISTI